MKVITIRCGNNIPETGRQRDRKHDSVYAWISVLTCDYGEIRPPDNVQNGSMIFLMYLTLVPQTTSNLIYQTRAKTSDFTDEGNVVQADINTSTKYVTLNEA